MGKSYSSAAKRDGGVALERHSASATKWSITGLGHALRSETSPAGIKVTIVEPPWVPHPGGNVSVGLEASATPSMEPIAQAVAATVGLLLEDPRHAFMTEVLIG